MLFKHVQFMTIAETDNPVKSDDILRRATSNALRAVQLDPPLQGFLALEGLGALAMTGPAVAERLALISELVRLRTGATRDSR